MPHLAPAVIVLECRPCWESELKQRLSREGILVRPCRTSVDLLNLVREMPGSIAIIDLRTDPASGLKVLQSVIASKAPVSPIVVSAEPDRELEWAARELGAVGFLTDTVSGNELADLCRRILGGGVASRVSHSAG